MTVTSLMGHRPYRDRNTDDLHRDRAYHWARSQTQVAGTQDENFTAMRLYEVEAELKFRGQLTTEFRAPPART